MIFTKRSTSFFIFIAVIMILLSAMTVIVIQPSEAQSGNTRYFKESSIGDETSWLTASGTLQDMIDDMETGGSGTLAIAKSGTTSTNINGEDSVMFDFTKSGTSSSLISYWPFESGTGTIAYDSIGSNDGTLAGNTWWTTGISGGGLSFDGDGDYVDLPENITLRPARITQLAWVNPATLGGVHPIMSLETTTGTSKGAKLDMYNGIFRFYVGTGSDEVQYVSGTVTKANEWYQVVGTYDGTEACIWINGEKVDCEPLSGNILYDTARDNRIGSWAPATPQYFNGIIDEVKVYDLALTGQEISDLYYNYVVRINTDPATDVGTSTATLNGTLNSLGTAGTVTVSFEYGTQSGSYPYIAIAAESPMSGTGPFHADVGGLIPGTTYYCRAKGEGAGTGYGEELSFTTLKTEVSTVAATNVGTSTATLNGTLDYCWTAGEIVSFEYGTQSGSYPYSAIALESPMSGTGPFHADISGLIPGTTCYFRAKGVGVGTDYGTELSFTTITIMYDLTLSSDTNGSVITPGEGTYAYEADTVVNIVAEGSYCYEFDGWTGSGTPAIANSGSPNTTITMNNDYSITANFVQRTTPVELRTSSYIGGSVSVPGEGAYLYSCGTTVAIVAEASPCYEFTGWTGSGKPFIANPYSPNTTIKMDNDCSIKANFEMTCAMVNIKVTLQGSNRPPSGWEVPITVGFFEPGSDVLSATPLYSFSGTTIMGITSNGTRAFFYCPAPVVPGTYDITTDSETTLLNIKRNVFIEASSANNVFPGQYVAIGNSLMEDKNNNFCREPLADSGNQQDSESEAWLREVDLPDIDSDDPSDDIVWEEMEISHAYLYWSGWFEDPSQCPDNIIPIVEDDCADFAAPTLEWATSPSSDWEVISGRFAAHDPGYLLLQNLVIDDCTTFDDEVADPLDVNWDSDIDWDISSGQFRGHNNGGGGTMQIADPGVDLSTITHYIEVSWDQSEAERLESDDCLRVFFYDNAGNWDEVTDAANYIGFCDELGTSTKGIYMIGAHANDDQYRHEHFRVQFRRGGFAGAGEYVYIDNFMIRSCLSSSSEADRELTLNDNLDLSPYQGREVSIVWDQNEDGDLENEDRLVFFLSNDGGNTWGVSEMAFFNDLSSPPDSYTDQIPQEYLTSQFRIKLLIGGFGEPDVWC